MSWFVWPTEIQFKLTYNREKQQSLTFETAELQKIWNFTTFAWKNDWNHQSAVKTVGDSLPSCNSTPPCYCATLTRYPLPRSHCFKLRRCVIPNDGSLTGGACREKPCWWLSFIHMVQMQTSNNPLRRLWIVGCGGNVWIPYLCSAQRGCINL